MRRTRRWLSLWLVMLVAGLAVRLCGQAVAQEGVTAASKEAVTRYLKEGEQRYARGDFRDASQTFEQALKLARQFGNRAGEATSLGSLGAVYSKLGNYPKALSYIEQSLKILREIGNRESEAASLGNLGVVYESLGDYPKAFDYYAQSLKIKREIGDTAGEAASLNNLGHAYWSLDDYPKALAYYEQSLKISREIGSRALEATTLNNIGQVYSNLDDYPKALAYFEQSLKIERELGNRAGGSASLNNLGLMYYDLGDYPKALDYYAQSLKIFREIGDRAGEAKTFGNLGGVYNSLGDYPKALDYYAQSLKISREIGDRADEATSLNNLGIVYDQVSNYTKALDHFQQAFELFSRIGAQPAAQRSKGNIAWMLLELGRMDEARVALDAGKASPGTYHLRTGDAQAAKAAFVRETERAEKTRNADSLVSAYIGLGLTEEALGDWGGARGWYQKAIAFTERQREGLTDAQRRHFFAAKVGGFPRLEPYEGLVRVSARLGDAAGALHAAEHTKARLLLENLAQRGQGNSLGLPATLAAEETNLTQGIASLAKQLETAIEKNNSTRQQEIERELPKLKEQQQALVTRLRQDYPEYASLAYPQPLQVQALKLLPGEALIEYEVTDTVTLAWLVREGKIVKAISLPITRKALAEDVKRYRGFFEGVRSTDQLARFEPALGKKLADLLLKDFLPLLKPEDQLIIVPDEILGVLPFEALVVALPAVPKTTSGKFGPVPQGVRYLGDTYAIRYAQSATALTLTRSLKKDPAPTAQTLLVVADPVFDIADARISNQKVQLAKRDDYQLNLMRAVEEYRAGTAAPGVAFGRLASTGKLPERLGNSLGGTQVDSLLGLSASEPEVRERLTKAYRYDVFATHGILDQDIPYIREPALVLSQINADAADPNKDGFLTMTEVMGLKIGADLVALTACNTGVGKQQTGEGVMGMGRAFQYAGARSVLMSLWSVEEESTNLLTERLFVHLKAGKDKLTALRQARSDVRQAGYEHPYYWAPFILVGEGR